MGFRREPDSGRLWFDGECVCYASASYTPWRLPLDEIRLIGEMTNQLGPFADDYFICFAKDSSGWSEASYYADGRDEFLRAIGDHLQTRLELRLTNSTDFASRILWPEHLVDLPMFEFTDKNPRGLWQRLRSYILPQNLQTFSSVSLRTLQRSTKSAGERTCSE